MTKEQLPKQNYKTREQIIGFALGELTGGWEGTPLEAYERLNEACEKDCNQDYFWDDVKVSDYEPYQDYPIGAFMEKLEGLIESLENFLHT